MPGFSTDIRSLQPDALVEQIARLQSKGDDGYSEGLFPAQRTHRLLGYSVEDDSIFPTAVVLYTLQQVRGALSASSRDTIDAITRKAVANYPKYLNNQGRIMYNFWQNVPEERFLPNSKLLSRFRIFHLPEDIDTTAYIYLTHSHAPEDIAWLKERLVLDTNGHRRHIRNTRPRYRRLRAYSTWLGDATMPIDFDVCALCNLMLFIFRHDLPLNEHDYDTLRYIASVITSDDHFDHPFDVAPWYGTTTLILYHVVRLMTTFDVPELAMLKDKLVHDLHRQHERTALFMERLTLSTSLMRLGEPALVTHYPDPLEPAFRRYYFFTGSLLTPIDHPLTWALAKRPFLQVRYRCRAHALALLLEHEVWKG